MPNQIGQAYGLTVYSPFLNGKDEDGIDHVEAARAFIHALEAARESPFARIVADARRTVHTARWVVLDALPREGGHFHEDALKSRYLILDVNFDTDARGLDGFLDDMARAIPEVIEKLYAHCVGYKGLASFADYVKKCQIETTFFFVDYAADDRGKVEHVHRALAVREGFAQLATSLQGKPALEQRKQIESFLEKLDWNQPPAPIVQHYATAPARPLVRQKVDLNDVQGNVLRAYKHPYARHLYFRVKDAALARAGLRKLVPEVDHSGDWGPEKPGVTFNLAFSHAGLVALGLPKRSLDGFPLAFRMGMAKRAPVLGDDGKSAPDDWEAPDGKAIWQDGVHVLASLYTNDASRLDGEARWVIESFGDGASLVGRQDAGQLRDGGGQLTKKEHFGFVDGLGTTDIETTGLDRTPGSGKLDEHHQWVGLAPGELLFGYRDEADEYPDAPNPPELVQNGTFLVYRKLKENVAVFRDYLQRHGEAYGDPDLLAAKMVGRFRDGTPLALSSVGDPALVADPHRNNDFLFGDDPEGKKCPITAHIRRSRPRDGLGFDGKVADRRRLQRRGMPYGPALPDGAKDDGADRGILFVAFCIDIERQFEFIQQQWINYGNSFGQGNDKDILTGNHDGTGRAVIQAAADKPPYVCPSLPRFVETRGGEYFFVPGIAALRSIAGL